MRQLQVLNPKMVVVLRKQAGKALEELADLTMPHPHAALKHGDKGEVFRKPRCSERLCLPREQIADATGDGSERRYTAPFSRPMWRGDWFTA